MGGVSSALGDGTKWITNGKTFGKIPTNFLHTHHSSFEVDSSGVIDITSLQDKSACKTGCGLQNGELPIHSATFSIACVLSSLHFTTKRLYVAKQVRGKMSDSHAFVRACPKFPICPLDATSPHKKLPTLLYQFLLPMVATCEPPTCHCALST